MNIKHRKGIVSQLIAQSYLAKQEDIIVFTPLDGLGPIDIITYNTKTKEYKKYDVKTVSFRQQHGTMINRSPTQQQKDLDVEILYVTEQGEIYPVPKRKFKNK
nr:hypothetical protein [uncultured Mediterranean phage uvMED]